MKAKVRELQVKSGCEWKTAFVYRGWYCVKGGVMAFHTCKYIKHGRQLNNLYGDDVFTLGEGRFDTPEIFKEIVDEHIEYIIRAHGSLEEYFKLNS
jgi:hypothetical protein